jgi:hypothetical protein
MVNQHSSSSKAVFDANISTMGKIRSLYSGVSYALCYKAMQRGYQYSAQPTVARKLAEHRVEPLHRWLGPKLGKTAEHAMAGSIVGVGEVLFLPIDSLKVKMQTNSSLQFTVGSQTEYVDILKGCYRGAALTAVRNSVGSFAFFGGAACTKEYVLQLKDYDDATFGQHFAASTAASVASILVSAPWDVVKARVQRQGGAANDGAVRIRSGFEVARELAIQEGPRAFFKGSVPKCFVVAPKIMFAYTLANWMTTQLMAGRHC